MTRAESAGSRETSITIAKGELRKLEAMDAVKAALEAKNLGNLEQALSDAGGAGVATEGTTKATKSLIDEARRQLKKLTAEKALKDALEAKRRNVLEQALNDAESAGAETSIIDEARRQLEKLKCGTCEGTGRIWLMWDCNKCQCTGAAR